LQVGTECAPFTTDARPVANGGTPKTEQLYKDCNSAMGPYQPGVTAKDPTDPNNTDNGAPGGNSTASSSPVPKANSLDKNAGKPAATKPLPGQLDPSVPHVVAPPQIQQLLQALQGKAPAGTPKLPNVNAPQAGSPSAQPTAGSSAEQVLNFLLAP